MQISGPAPNGGDYIDVQYVDAAGNPAESDVATRFIIREYTGDGTLLKEVHGQREPNSAGTCSNDEIECYMYLLGL